MKLPLKTSYAAIEAKAVDRLPSGEGWQFEPKWDGFRCLAFRDSDDVELRSMSGQALARYFPEIINGLLAVKAKQGFTEAEVVTRKKLLRWRPDKAPRQCTFDQVLAKKVKRSSSRKTRGATAA